MKRALALLFAVALVVPRIAHAEWVTEELKWRLSSQGTPTNAGGIYIRDTTYRNLEFETVGDTTAAFTLDHASILPRGVVGPGITGTSALWPFGTTRNDTTTIAWVVVQMDSSVIAVPTLSSLTVAFDGRVGGFGSVITQARGWVKADSALINSAGVAPQNPPLIVGSESIAIPIRTISPYGNIGRWSSLRMRTTAGTGIMGACRVFIRYWIEPGYLRDR